MSDFYQRSLNRSRKASAVVERQGPSMFKKEKPMFAKIAKKSIKDDQNLKPEAFYAFKIFESFDKTAGCFKVSLNPINGLKIINMMI